MLAPMNTQSFHRNMLVMTYHISVIKEFGNCRNVDTGSDHFVFLAESWLNFT